MTIQAHSLIADLYKNRPPYVAGFFKRAVEKLGISTDSVLLDLCCGRGELASGFAPSCETIYAVDGSQQMLNHSIAMPNVKYLLHDVNNEDVVLPQNVDHIVIGSAVHWIEPPKLARLIERNLNPGGKVMVSHPLLQLEDQPWYPAMAQLNARFGRAGVKGFRDLEGADRLHACGFGRVDAMRIVRQVDFGVAWLYGNQLSYLYDKFYEQVSKNREAYREQLEAAVVPYLDERGHLSGRLINWGVVYGRR